MVPSLYPVQGKSLKSPAFQDTNQILTHLKDYNLAFNLMVMSKKLLEIGMQELVMCYRKSVPMNSA